MIKYGRGLPVNVPAKYAYYIDTDTNIIYKRKQGIWVEFRRYNPRGH